MFGQYYIRGIQSRDGKSDFLTPSSDLSVMYAGYCACRSNSFDLIDY